MKANCSYSGFFKYGHLSVARIPRNGQNCRGAGFCLHRVSTEVVRQFASSLAQNVRNDQ